MAVLRKRQHCTHWCQSEVSNGGFHQFFSNSTGVLAPEAVAGFHAIGLTECGDIFSEAMMFFGPSCPHEREIRTSILDSVPGKIRAEWDPFYSTDNRFYIALKSGNKSFEIVADEFAQTLAG